LFADEGSVLFDVDGPCTGFVLILDGEIEVSRPSASAQVAAPPPPPAAPLALAPRVNLPRRAVPDQTEANEPVRW